MKTSIMGIYQIKNVENGKMYIGSSKNIHQRWKQHNIALKYNNHCNLHLQGSYNKYGKDKFEYSIIELVATIDILLSQEYQWINQLNTLDARYGYNIANPLSEHHYSKYTNSNSKWLQLNTPLILKEFKIKDEDYSLVYTNNIQNLINLNLTPNEKLVYYILRDLVNNSANSITINNQVPEMKDLECVVGLKERTIRKAIKSLEVKGLFKLQQAGHKKQIFVNPTYYASGKELDIDTLKMFGILECDEAKVESYLNEDIEAKVSKKHKIHKEQIEDIEEDDDEPDFSLEEIFEIADREEFDNGIKPCANDSLFT